MITTTRTTTTTITIMMTVKIAPTAQPSPALCRRVGLRPWVPLSPAQLGAVVRVPLSLARLSPVPSTNGPAQPRAISPARQKKPMTMTHSFQLGGENHGNKER